MSNYINPNVFFSMTLCTHHSYSDTTHRHTNKCTNTLMHTQHANMHIITHTHSYTHTRVHTHTHTHTHTHHPQVFISIQPIIRIYVMLICLHVGILYEFMYCKTC